MGFRGFEEIEVWQEARKFTRIVRSFCRRAIAKKDWAWADQMSRASLSIMANIAEGNDAQTNTEFIQFLDYAKRSAAETRSHLFYGFDEEYINQQEFNQAIELSRKIASQLAKLIDYLRSHPHKYRKDLSCNVPTCNVQQR